MVALLPGMHEALIRSFHLRKKTKGLHVTQSERDKISEYPIILNRFRGENLSWAHRSLA